MAVESTNQYHVGHEGTWELKDCVNPVLAKYRFFKNTYSRQTFLSLCLFCYSKKTLFVADICCKTKAKVLQVFGVQSCAINTQLIAYLLHNLCTVTLAARCQTLAGLQQCPLPPPRIGRQCCQIPSTITCTSEAPINLPEDQRYHKTT